MPCSSWRNRRNQSSFYAGKTFNIDPDIDIRQLPDDLFQIVPLAFSFCHRESPFPIERLRLSYHMNQLFVSQQFLLLSTFYSFRCHGNFSFPDKPSCRWELTVSGRVRRMKVEPLSVLFRQEAVLRVAARGFLIFFIR